MTKKLKFDAIIIGGGFYGSMVALHLSKALGIKKIAILERNEDIFSRASFNNQYRIHNGYHYPRSFNTANRSRMNFRKFIDDWPEAVVNKNTSSLYAIPKLHSKVNAKQFLKFCRSINAKIGLAKKKHKRLFQVNNFEEIFEVEEYCFDPKALKRKIKKELIQANISIITRSEAFQINLLKGGVLKVSTNQAGNSEGYYYSDLVFNCSYSGLGQLKGDAAGPLTSLKHEIAEIAFVKLTKEFSNLGITIMDGPFFSFLPTSLDYVHSLSHVRYSPHISWHDNKNINPYKKMESSDNFTRVERMVRSAEKYVPLLTRSKYIGSKFEIKTLLEKNEVDDGRPILFEKDLNLPNLIYVLGSKIDNIYDVLGKIDQEIR